MRKLATLLLGCAMVLSLGAAAVFGGRLPGANASAAAEDLWIRTDTVAAQNADGTAKVSAETTAVAGAEEVVGGSLNVLKLTAQNNAVFEFKLPAGVENGTLRFFGTSLEAASLSAYNGTAWVPVGTGGSAGKLAAVGETGSGGKKTHSVYTAEVNVFADASARLVKVKIGGADASVYSAAMYPGQVRPILEEGETLTWSRFSYEELGWAIYYSQGASAHETYINNGTPCLRLNNLAIFEVFVSAETKGITLDQTTVADGKIRYRDAAPGGGINGDVNAYEAFAKGDRIDVSGFGKTVYNGKNCYRIQFVAWGGANAFFQSLSLTSDSFQAEPVSSLRTDSLTASTRQAKIVSSTASVVDASNDKSVTNNVLEFTEGKETVVEFALPGDTAEGEVRFYGKNLDKLKIGIYDGKTANDGYYLMSDAAYLGDGTYGVLRAGFGSDTWYDSAKSTVRFRLWGLTAGQTAQLRSVSVVTDKQFPVLKKDETFEISHLSDNETLSAKYYGDVSTYFNDKGVASMHVNPGIAIWEMRVSAKANTLKMGISTLNSVHLGIRDASASSAADGTPAHYTQFQNNEDVSLQSYTVIDPDKSAASGDEYYLVHFIAWNAGDSFLSGISASAKYVEPEKDFNSMTNANTGVKTEAYSYFAVGSEAEKAHIFADASKGTDYLATFAATHSGMFADTANGGNFKAENARKLKAGESLFYEFKMPSGTNSAVLKIFSSGSLTVKIHSSDSVKRKTVLPASKVGAKSYGAVIYKLGAGDAFVSGSSFRVEIKNESNAAGSIFAVSVDNGTALDMSGSTHFAPFSESSLKYLADANVPDLYFMENDIPAWLLNSGNSLTYKFKVPAGKSKAVLAMTGSNAVGLKYSTDGETFTSAASLDNSGGSIGTTVFGKISVTAGSTLYVKAEGGQGFLMSFDVSFPDSTAKKYEFDTMTAEEASHFESFSANTGKGAGLVGQSHKSFSKIGRRLGFGAAAPAGANLVYRFDFAADSEQALWLNMKAVKGSYRIWISSDAAFPAGKTLETFGSAPREVLFDASSALADAKAAGGSALTVYVKISHNAAEANTDMGGGMDLVFERFGMFADGTKGAGWPNDDDFDYGDAPDYEPNPGLPEVPKDPDPVAGTDTFGGGEGGCGGGAKETAVVVLGAAAAALLLKRRG